MQKLVSIPEELLTEIEQRHPFPWTQHIHPNGLIQVGDRQNVEVDILLLIKLAITVGEGLKQNG